jgi:hypothetical protein
MFFWDTEGQVARLVDPVYMLPQTTLGVRIVKVVLSCGAGCLNEERLA